MGAERSEAHRTPLIILTGPTAVGKTELSIKLAKKIGGEIISADSVSVYRYMDIGSAKITEAEMGGIPHYLVNVLDPSEEFNVVCFQAMGKAAIKDIRSRGKIPIVVGGTGFYIQGLLYDVDFTKSRDDPGIRQELTEFLETRGEAALFELLKETDPESASRIPPENHRRVIRALEYFRLTGEKISLHNERERKKESPYLFEYFVLNRPRRELYERINARVDDMFRQGLVKEVTALRDMGCKRNLVSMQGLGYKEVYAALEGEISLEEAKEQIKQNTRHFAKRQMTWFRRERTVTMIDYDQFSYDPDRILDFIMGRLKEKGMI